MNYERVVRKLILRGWMVHGDLWSNHLYTNQGLPILYTVEQAAKIEKLALEDTTVNGV